MSVVGCQTEQEALINFECTYRGELAGVMIIVAAAIVLVVVVVLLWGLKFLDRPVGEGLVAGHELPGTSPPKRPSLGYGVIPCRCAHRFYHGMRKSRTFQKEYSAFLRNTAHISTRNILWD